MKGELLIPQRCGNCIHAYFESVSPHSPLNPMPILAKIKDKLKDSKNIKMQFRDILGLCFKTSYRYRLTYVSRHSLINCIWTTGWPI